jgi:glycosyltransferase involved in cell wall biosynthesis
MSDNHTRKILVNSLPKSGTNMVQKCLELAGVPYSKRSVAASSMFGRYARIKSLLRDVSVKETPVVVGLEIPVGISPSWLHEYLHGASGYVSGHAAYSSHYHSILQAAEYKTIQVVRHPCAVLASWANYIAEPGYYWRDAQRVFARMSPQERVRLMLYGGLLDKSDTRLYYRGFSEVWNQVQGWVDSSDVLTVKYEDLVGSQGGGSDELQRDLIEKMMRHVGIEANAVEVNRIAANLYGGTHTFRQGSIEGWRKLIDADLEAQVYEQLHGLPVMKTLNYFDTTDANPADLKGVSGALGKVPSTHVSDKKLKVLLVTEGYGQSLFGVAKVVEDLRRRMGLNGAVMKLAALVVGKNEVAKQDGSIVELPYWNWTKTLRFHWLQASALADVVDNFQPDVIHVHGVLVPLQRAAVACAMKRKIPVVISVHGMLEPWLWRQRSVVHYWLKRLYWNVVMKSVLKSVDYVHVITQQEADTLSVELPKAPQILIPNAIDLAEFNPQQCAPDTERYILFLGRIHPKKGIGLLISAFAELDTSGCRLLIAGSDHSVEYTNELKEMVRAKNLQDKVSFLGGVFGDEKLALLAKAWVVAVPSYSDVIALVNLEAAASFTPTITTNMTGLSDWADSGGLLIDPDALQLKQALEQVLSWSLEDRLAKGLQSRQFVADRYSWDVVGKHWMDTYQKIASGVRL